MEYRDPETEPSYSVTPNPGSTMGVLYGKNSGGVFISFWHRAENFGLFWLLKKIENNFDWFLNVEVLSVSQQSLFSRPLF